MPWLEWLVEQMPEGDFLEAVTPILQANSKAVALAGRHLKVKSGVDELESYQESPIVAEQIKRTIIIVRQQSSYNMFYLCLAKYQSRSSTNCSPRSHGLW